MFKRWAGIIGVEGERTGDDRIVREGALRWDRLPIPLRYVSQDVGAHDGAVVVGKIEQIERREQEDGPTLIWGAGIIDMDSDIGAEAFRQVDEGLMTGVSMDLDDVTFEVETIEMSAEDGADPTVSIEAGELMSTTQARIRAATIVAIPAFEQAHIGVDSAQNEDIETLVQSFTRGTPKAKEQSMSRKRTTDRKQSGPKPGTRKRPTPSRHVHSQGARPKTVSKQTLAAKRAEFAYNPLQWRNPRNGRWIDMPGKFLGELADFMEKDRSSMEALKPLKDAAETLQNPKNKPGSKKFDGALDTGRAAVREIKFEAGKFPGSGLEAAVNQADLALAEWDAQDFQPDDFDDSNQPDLDEAIEQTVGNVLPDALDEELQDLQDELDGGVITQKEYDKREKQILDRAEDAAGTRDPEPTSDEGGLTPEDIQSIADDLMEELSAEGVEGDRGDIVQRLNEGHDFQEILESTLEDALGGGEDDEEFEDGDEIDDGLTKQPSDDDDEDDFVEAEDFETPAEELLLAAQGMEPNPPGDMTAEDWDEGLDTIEDGLARGDFEDAIETAWTMELEDLAQALEDLRDSRADSESAPAERNASSEEADDEGDSEEGLSGDFNLMEADPKKLNDTQLREAIAIAQTWMNNMTGNELIEVMKAAMPFVQEAGDRGMDLDAILPDSKSARAERNGADSDDQNIGINDREYGLIQDVLGALGRAGSDDELVMELMTAFDAEDRKAIRAALDKAEKEVPAAAKAAIAIMDLIDSGELDEGDDEVSPYLRGRSESYTDAIDARAEFRKGNGENWIEQTGTGSLPSYIREIADALPATWNESRRIATAVNTVKRWARGGPAAAGGEGSVNADTIAKAAAALAEWEAKRAQAKANAARPESLVASARSKGDRILRAVPVDPPAAWFENPKLTEPTPMVVTAEGRVYGHLATWDACHIASPTGANICTEPPRTLTEYAHFHTGAVLTAEGHKVATGRLVQGGKHAPDHVNWQRATQHYDQTSKAIADVRVGEDSIGIWYSGALRPNVTATDLREFRASPVSGDWRMLGGNLELVAGLAVNVGGFNVPRPRGLVASARWTGKPEDQELVSLVAAAVLPARMPRNSIMGKTTDGNLAIGKLREDSLTPGDLQALKSLANRERALTAKELAQRVHKARAEENRKKVEALASKLVAASATTTTMTAKKGK